MGHHIQRVTTQSSFAALDLRLTVWVTEMKQMNLSNKKINENAAKFSSVQLLVLISMKLNQPDKCSQMD